MSWFAGRAPDDSRGRGSCSRPPRQGVHLGGRVRASCAGGPSRSCGGMPDHSASFEERPSLRELDGRLAGILIRLSRRVRRYRLHLGFAAEGPPVRETRAAGRWSSRRLAAADRRHPRGRRGRAFTTSARSRSLATPGRRGGRVDARLPRLSCFAQRLRIPGHSSPTKGSRSPARQDWRSSATGLRAHEGSPLGVRAVC